MFDKFGNSFIPFLELEQPQNNINNCKNSIFVLIFYSKFLTKYIFLKIEFNEFFKKKKGKIVNKNKVVLGMSSDVDSSVAATLLKEMGFEVYGITLKTWGHLELVNHDTFELGCCSLKDARCVADNIGISHVTKDISSEFENQIIGNFINEYINGRTPNPCTVCNREIKWKYLLDYANSIDAYFVATGHYSIIEEVGNKFLLKRSLDKFKDQTYFLWKLTQEDLSRTIFPLAKFTKPEIREIAKKYGIHNASKPDSQEICFVNDSSYTNFINQKLIENNIKVEVGDFVYKDKVVGKHKGVHNYTVGQRRGIGIALGKPIFVTKIDKELNIVYLGDYEDLLTYEVKANFPNYQTGDLLKENQQVVAKIRYGDPGTPTEVLISNENEILLKFKEPKSAVTPGQSLVIYDNNFEYLLAGGVITLE